MNDFNAIRDFYREMLPLIEASPKNDWAADPYAWSEVIRMTHIEEWLWADIRQADVILYPQFPVGRFFVDFANPRAKVAIECDGRAYHLDKAKDAARDAELASMGWRVYRITGSDCFREFNEETRAPSPARKFIDDIAARHGIKRVPSKESAPNQWFERLVRSSPELLREAIHRAKQLEVQALNSGDSGRFRACQEARRVLEGNLAEIDA